MESLKRTPLYEEHKVLKARMVPFGGWEMPVQYTNLIQEHTTVRTQVGLFDVSHMGEFLISGQNAKEFLNRVTTNDVSEMYDGRCQYTLMCYENGTVVDDLIISQLSSDKFLLVVNASNIDKDFEWLVSQNKEGVQLKNISSDMALLAIQGPQANKVVTQLFDQNFSDLKYYHFRIFDHQGSSVSISRTGYTGEDGYELMVPSDKAVEYWKAILNVGANFGIVPVGLGARDTLRLEAAYSLYGHEISDQINPLEARLAWVVKLDKGDFVGKDALLQQKKQGLKKQVVGFEMLDAGIARQDYSVFSSDQKIGIVTSGTHSPTLKKAIGLALVDIKFSKIGTEILIDIRNQKKNAVVVKTPFYKKP